MQEGKRKVWVIGLFTLIVTVGLILFYDFLKGRDLFDKESHYYVFFNQVDGLYASNRVLINGMRVGQVSGIRFADDESGRLLVALQLPSSQKLSVETTASIINTGLVGGRVVRLDGALSGPPYLRDGDTLRGQTNPSYAEMMDTDLQPIISDVSLLLHNLTILTSWVNETLDSNMRRDLRGTLSHVHSASGRLDELAAELPSVVGRAGRVLDEFTLAVGDVRRVADGMGSVVDTLLTADLSRILHGVDSTVCALNALTGSLARGEGSVGKLLTSDSVYHEVRRTVGHLDSLLVDLKKNPKRYVNFSLF